MRFRCDLQHSFLWATLYLYADIDLRRIPATASAFQIPVCRERIVICDPPSDLDKLLAICGLPPWVLNLHFKHRAIYRTIIFIRIRVTWRSRIDTGDERSRRNLSCYNLLWGGVFHRQLDCWWTTPTFLPSRVNKGDSYDLQSKDTNKMCSRTSCGSRSIAWDQKETDIKMFLTWAGNNRCGYDSVCVEKSQGLRGL